MRINKVVEPGTAPKSPTIDQHCVTLFCVTQIIVALATAGRVYGRMHKSREEREKCKGRWE